MEQLSFDSLWSHTSTTSEPEPPSQVMASRPSPFRPTTALVTPDGMTFADAYAYVSGRTDWNSQTRSTMRSSCRKAAWSVGSILARRKGEPFEMEIKKVDLTKVPFDIGMINDAWDGQSHRAAGFEEEKSFRNVRSDVRRIGRALGIIADYQAPPLSPGHPFMPLELAAGYYDRSAIRRFIGWCHDQHLAPADVESSTLIQYGEFLRHHLIRVKVNDVMTVIVRVWEAAAGSTPTWPQTSLTKPGGSYRYTLPFDAYPESLSEDIDRFIDWMAGTDRAAPFSQPGRKRPMRPATINCRRKAIRQAAWALVATGRDHHEITDLSCLVSPEAVETILTYYWERAQEQRTIDEDDEPGQYSNGNTAQLQGIGITLASIAEHHCRIDPDQLEEVRALAAAARVTPRGKPTAKNRERLRQFDDLRTRADLLALPRLLMDEAVDMVDAVSDARSSARDKRDRLADAARLARLAIMIGILLRIPLRIKNLCSIRLGKNLKFLGGSDDTVLLTFQEHETKNWVELEFSVGPRLRDLIRTYIEKFLPFFADESPDFATMNWLFPSGEGRSSHLSISQARKVISRTIDDHVGATVNPHLFRALAVKFCLERSPGALEQCRLLLGDKKLDVILRYYAAMEEKEAARRQDALVDAEEQRLAQYRSHKPAKSAKQAKPKQARRKQS